jgi:hypothetical protein
MGVYGVLCLGSGDKFEVFGDGGTEGVGFFEVGDGKLEGIPENDFSIFGGVLCLDFFCGWVFGLGLEKRPHFMKKRIRG